MHHGHVAVLVLLAARAFHEVSAHETHLVAREHAEIFPGRLLHEVLPLDVHLAAKGHQTAAELRVLQVIGDLKLLHLALGIVVDHQLHRVQNRHHSGLFQLQILADAVFQHSVVHGAVGLGNAHQVHEHADGLRRVAPSAQGRDGNQTRIVPAVHDLVLHQLLDVALARDHIGQVQLGKLDLAGRILKFALLHHPVVQRSVILELQGADGVGDILDGILDGMGEIVHGVNAPLVPGVVVGHAGHAVDHRVAHVDVGGGHVDLGPQHLCAVLVFPLLHLLEEL